MLRASQQVAAAVFVGEGLHGAQNTGDVIAVSFPDSALTSSTLDQLRSEVRLHLSKLSKRNDHHGFMRLCYEVARVHIASNILLATGPLGAGGDQGRDFESYRTYVGGLPLGPQAIVGRASGDLLVFTCSTRQTHIRRKILNDVTAVVGGQERPQVVYHSTTAYVAVAARHELQAQCRANYGASLEILDLQAHGP